MKKYFISFLIPCLLFYFVGCYSIQRVTKNELLSSESPELIIKTENKEFKFEEKSYFITNDTLRGKGNFIYLEENWEPFEGQLSVNDVETIKLNKMGNKSEAPEMLITTKEREYIFKNEKSSYLVNNDTIYGKGKSKLINDQFQFDGKIGIDDVKEIQINKFNLLNTLLLVYLGVGTITLIVAAATYKGPFIKIW